MNVTELNELRVAERLKAAFALEVASRFLLAGPHKFSTTQVDLPPMIASAIFGYQAMIPQADLAPDALEMRPHVTIKYGLHTQDASQVEELLSGVGPIVLELGKTAIFEGEEYDVLYAIIKSPELVVLNAYLSSRFEVTDTHPVYQPHATIAYLRPGLGKNYAGDDLLAGMLGVIDAITFVSASGDETVINLLTPALARAASAVDLEPLADDAVQSSLEELDGDWSVKNNALVRDFMFADRRQCAAFIARLMQDANLMNHHPDVKTGDNGVRVLFTTHQAGDKLTALDFQGAKAADAFALPYRAAVGNGNNQYTQGDVSVADHQKAIRRLVGKNANLSDLRKLSKEQLDQLEHHVGALAQEHDSATARMGWTATLHAIQSHREIRGLEDAGHPFHGNQYSNVESDLNNPFAPSPESPFVAMPKSGMRVKLPDGRTGRVVGEHYTGMFGHKKTGKVEVQLDHMHVEDIGSIRVFDPSELKHLEDAGHPFHGNQYTEGGAGDDRFKGFTPPNAKHDTRETAKILEWINAPNNPPTKEQAQKLMDAYAAIDKMFQDPDIAPQLYSTLTGFALPSGISSRMEALRTGWMRAIKGGKGPAPLQPIIPSVGTIVPRAAAMNPKERVKQADKLIELLQDPTTAELVAALMTSVKKAGGWDAFKKQAGLRAAEDAGHEFHGNQYTDGAGGGDKGPWKSSGGFEHTGIVWKQPTDPKTGRPIPIKVKDIAEAVALVHEGKVVEVPDVKSAHTLISRLAEMAQEAKAAGQEAKDYDLCQVSVPGTNMFCTESLRTQEYPDGVPRLDMPQLGGKPVPGSEADQLPRNPWDPSEVDGSAQFVDYLRGIGVRTSREEAPAANLKASQRELIGSKVAKMMNDKSFDPATNPIFVSSDNYVVDGHHRWAAVVGRDAENGVLGDATMKLIKVNAPISEVLQLANAWSKKFGIQQVAGVAK